VGKFIPSEDRLTFEDMVKDLENDYRINGKRSLSTIRYYTAHLKEFFGLDRAIDIAPDRVRAYQTRRLEEEASNATVNREVACLGRMLTLAVNAGKLSRRPKLQTLEENNVRQGFLEHGDFLILLSHLPAHLQPVAEYLYLSGWRKGEALKLEWRDVDVRGRVVRLRIENSKNKESRVLALTGRLWEMMEERVRERRLDCPYVFHDDGERIGDFRKAWYTACITSGLGRMEKLSKGSKQYVGLIPHDLRRCAARNLSRAGVPEVVAMKITGHKTSSMYRRYRIVDERDLREATERLQTHLETQDKTPAVRALARS
jgi:integrase